MRYAAPITALALASAALAQNTTVHVGKGGLVFDPANITATEGSVITFVFDGAPGNHTVAQSSFAKPCNQVEKGFDSGFITVPPNTTDGFPTWNLTVSNASTPIWFYCAQLSGAKPHCEAGMVGSINAPASGNRTFEAFKSLAEQQTEVPNPTPALSGVGAFATIAPGPFSGNVTGFAVPTGTLPASGGNGSGNNGNGSGSGSGGNTTQTGGNNGAGALQVSGFVAFLAAAFGVVLV